MWLIFFNNDIFPDINSTSIKSISQNYFLLFIITGFVTTETFLYQSYYHTFLNTEWITAHCSLMIDLINNVNVEFWWLTWCFSTLRRWQRTFRRCLTSARTEQRTNFCCRGRNPSTLTIFKDEKRVLLSHFHCCWDVNSHSKIFLIYCLMLRSNFSSPMCHFYLFTFHLSFTLWSWHKTKNEKHRTRLKFAFSNNGAICWPNKTSAGRPVEAKNNKQTSVCFS